MFSNVFKGKKVLVTGDTGFKGGWISSWLLELGANVFGISKDIPSNPSLFETAGLEKKINHHWCDVRDLDKVKEIISEIRPDVVFHLAAQPIVSSSYENPVETFSSNVMGTVNILEALRVLDHSCVAVMITSDKCYDNAEWVWGYKETDHLGGKDIYSGSKGAAELVIKSYFNSFFKDGNIKIASVRAGNVIGGGDWAKDRIVPDCYRAWSQDKNVVIRNLYSTRPWQHVLEPLSGYLLAAEKLLASDKFSGESYNFGPSSDCNFTVLDLLTGLAKTWGFSDIKKAFEHVSRDSFHEAKLLKLNCDKALFDFKWKPTLNYEETISFVGDWYSFFYKDSQNTYEFSINQIKKYEIIGKEKGNVWAQN